MLVAADYSLVPFLDYGIVLVFEDKFALGKQRVQN